MQITATEKFYEISFLGKESFDNFLRFIDYNYHAFNIIFPKGYGNSPAVLFDSSYSIVFTNSLGNRYSFGYFKVLTQEEYNNMLSGNVVPINLEGSATNLIRYYPMLSSCTPNYENASYSIGINEKSKTEIGNKTPNIKKG